MGNTKKPFLVLVKAINRKIKNCEIHESTKIILDYAFGFCEDLTDITIPENVKSIGIAAFINCKSFKKSQFQIMYYILVIMYFKVLSELKVLYYQMGYHLWVTGHFMDVIV